MHLWLSIDKLLSIKLILSLSKCPSCYLSIVNKQEVNLGWRNMPKELPTDAFVYHQTVTTPNQDQEWWENPCSFAGRAWHTFSGFKIELHISDIWYLKLTMSKLALKKTAAFPPSHSPSFPPTLVLSLPLWLPSSTWDYRYEPLHLASGIFKNDVLQIKKINKID